MAENKKDDVGLTQDDYNVAMVNIFSKMQESLESLANTLERQYELDKTALDESMEAMKEEMKWREENGQGGPMEYAPPSSFRTDKAKDKD